MNKLLKYIIYFLLGIIIYYFLLNKEDKLIEGHEVGLGENPCTSYAEFSTLSSAMSEACCGDGNCVDGIPAVCSSDCEKLLLPMQGKCSVFIDTIPQDAQDNISKLATVCLKESREHIIWTADGHQHLPVCYDSDSFEKVIEPVITSCCPASKIVDDGPCDTSDGKIKWKYSNCPVAKSCIDAAALAKDACQVYAEPQFSTSTVKQRFNLITAINDDCGDHEMVAEAKSTQCLYPTLVQLGDKNWIIEQDIYGAAAADKNTVITLGCNEGFAFVNNVEELSLKCISNGILETGWYSKNEKEIYNVSENILQLECAAEGGVLPPPTMPADIPKLPVLPPPVIAMPADIPKLPEVIPPVAKTDGTEYIGEITDTQMYKMYQFEATQGRTYNIEIMDPTRDQPDTLDTIIQILDNSSEKTMLVENDDRPEREGLVGVNKYASFIEWTAQTTGTYYVLVKTVDPDHSAVTHHTGKFTLKITKLAPQHAPRSHPAAQPTVGHVEVRASNADEANRIRDQLQHDRSGSPTHQDTEETDLCDDISGWVDSEGKTCIQYVSLNHCTGLEHDQFAVDGISAEQACRTSCPNLCPPKGPGCQDYICKNNLLDYPRTNYVKKKNNVSNNYHTCNIRPKNGYCDNFDKSDNSSPEIYIENNEGIINKDLKCENQNSEIGCYNVNKYKTSESNTCIWHNNLEYPYPNCNNDICCDNLICGNSDSSLQIAKAKIAHKSDNDESNLVFDAGDLILVTDWTRPDFYKGVKLPDKDELITDGTLYGGNITDPAVAKKYKFKAYKNNTYEIETVPSSSTIVGNQDNTIIQLLNTDGETVLLENDNRDDLQSYFSFIRWAAPTTGIYYVKVTLGGINDPSELPTDSSVIVGNNLKGTGFFNLKITNTDSNIPGGWFRSEYVDFTVPGNYVTNEDCNSIGKVLMPNKKCDTIEQCALKSHCCSTTLKDDVKDLFFNIKNI
jgi:hypothetical protein